VAVKSGYWVPFRPRYASFFNIVGIVLVLNIHEIFAFGRLATEYHTICILKTSFLDFEEEYARCSRYKKP
jgi:hypothetical protein